MEDIRNRLSRARFPDEPLEGFEVCQDTIDLAYRLKSERKFEQVQSLLERDTHPNMSHYQSARVEYLLGECYREQAESTGVSGHLLQLDPIGKAAEHYRLGAEAVERIPDWLLYAQLKAMESAACYGSNPHKKRYRRAFEAAKAALKSWRTVPMCNCLQCVDYEYKLADELAIRAYMVAEDEDSVDALDRAAVLLQRLHRRKNVDPARYKQDDLFLEWDWAAIHHSIGEHALALKRALKARIRARNFPDRRNYGRINALIAEIALDCIDSSIVWQGYTQPRLIAVAEKAVAEALGASKESSDNAGHVLALLVHARLLRAQDSESTTERLAVLNRAYDYASSIEATDPILHARAEIGLGDEYAWRNMRRKSTRNVETAQAFYEQALKRLTEVEALCIARIAQQRLARLSKTTQAVPKRPRRSPRKPSAPRPRVDLSLN